MSIVDSGAEPAEDWGDWPRIQYVCGPSFYPDVSQRMSMGMFARGMIVELFEDELLPNHGHRGLKSSC
jgi:hypothetical protein